METKYKTFLVLEFVLTVLVLLFTAVGCAGKLIKSPEPSHDVAAETAVIDESGQVQESFYLKAVRELSLGYLNVTPGTPYSIISAPWMYQFLLGEMLGANGEEFTQWALEELYFS